MNSGTKYRIHYSHWNALPSVLLLINLIKLFRENSECFDISILITKNESYVVTDKNVLEKMSDGRKRLSGFAYKKRAAEKTEKENEVLSKTPQFDTFFKKREGANHTVIDRQISGIILETKVKCNTAMAFLPQPIPEKDKQISSSMKVDEAKKVTDTALGDNPGQWAIDDFIRDYVAKNGCGQNKNLDFSNSKKEYTDGRTRYLSQSLFQIELLNGEKISRPWLVYSASKGTVFCVVCLLFALDCAFNGKDGFNDWKHTSFRVAEHENSRKHKKCIFTMEERGNTDNRIDKDLTAQADAKMTYWKDVLRRVFAATKALASCGLSFRGSDEKFGSPNNGNFLMLLEFLAEFDQFLSDHIRRFGNKRSGTASYLSKTIYEKCIQLIEEKFQYIILQEVKIVKYYAIVVDSTPDISHVDHLSLIIRYVKSDGTPVERFLLFIENPGHKVEL